MAAFRNPTERQLVVVLVNAREDAVNEEIELRGYRLEDIEVFRTSAEEDIRAAEPATEAGSRLSLTLAPRSISTLRASLRQVSPNRPR